MRARHWTDGYQAPQQLPFVLQRGEGDAASMDLDSWAVEQIGFRSWEWQLRQWGRQLWQLEQAVRGLIGQEDTCVVRAMLVRDKWGQFRTAAIALVI